MHLFVLFMSFFSIVQRYRSLLSPLLLTPALIGSFCSGAMAQVQVGTNQGVNFDQALRAPWCAQRAWTTGIWARQVVAALESRERRMAQAGCRPQAAHCTAPRP